MIVYRDQRTRADPRQLLADLHTRILRSGSSELSHELAIGTLIDVGILESAVVDALFPERDGIDPIAHGVRRLSLTAGHVVWHSWHRNSGGTALWWHRLSMAANAVAASQLPVVVEMTQPEGYSHYSLYPEMYLEAARSFVACLGRVEAVCLGIRSIGCSLSAVVAASLEELGCPAESYTLRPRGHPFSRFPRLTDELARRLTSAHQSHFLLVDEGPGLSGSSLGGTARWLHDLGIADDHIHLVPAWATDGSGLRSPAAREQWPRHRQFTGSFDDIWLNQGRLQQSFAGTLSDVSGGRWRERVLPGSQPYPAVHPQHERRKYVLTTENGRKKLLSFAGLGRVGERRVARLSQLAEAKFTPAPEKLAQGFMMRRFHRGVPVQRGCSNSSLLDFVASYLAHLYRFQAAEPTTTAESMEEMVRVNLAEGLRDPWLEKQVERIPRGVWTERPVALDGRMMAHEWIATSQGYLKVDAMDHHDDHFFPGCADIAWDVVGACVELNLSRQDRRYLIDRYRSLSHDRTIENRLHAFATAYLAFRLGYATLAAETLAESEDGQRFAREQRRYHDLLVHELSHHEAFWHD